MESLGKELGLEVPSELSQSEHNYKPPPTQKEVVNINSGDISSSILSVNRKLSLPSSAIADGFITQEIRKDNIHHPKVSHDDVSHEAIGNITQGSGSQKRGTGLFENVFVKSRLDVPQVIKKENTSTGRQDRSLRFWFSSQSFLI